MKIVVEATAEATANSAARWVGRRIRSAVRRRGACRLAVSGGSTPAAMFDVLATMDLPWGAVHLFQVDERVAPDGHPERNATQLTEHLSGRVPIPRGNVHLMPVGAASLERAARTYAASVAATPLDVVHLGIGDDGHTASWPPGDPVIDVAAATAISDVFNGRVRMTLTPGVVNAARARMVLAVGSSKAGPLAGWLREHADLPIARVRRTGTTLILDASAAAGLAVSPASTGEAGHASQ